MKIPLGMISWATGTLMLAAVSACSGNDADPPSSSPSSSSSSPSESPGSASPTSPSEAASTAAESVVRDYFSGRGRTAQATRQAAQQSPRRVHER